MHFNERIVMARRLWRARNGRMPVVLMRPSRDWLLGIMFALIVFVISASHYIVLVEQVAEGEAVAQKTKER